MRIKILFILGIAVILGCALSWAELNPPEKSSLAQAETEEAPTISMDFKDANLKDILKIVAKQPGLNFMASEDIAEKKVTLYLDNVSVSDALNSIMQANNLTYEQAKSSRVLLSKVQQNLKLKPGPMSIILNMRG